MEGTPMVLSIADVMPAAAEIFVAIAACVLLLVDALGGARARVDAVCPRHRRACGCGLGQLGRRGPGARGDPGRAFRRRPDGHRAEALRLRRRGRDAPVFARLSRAARAAEGRVPGAGAVRRAGNPGHRVGRQLPDALPRHRDHVAVPLCHGGLRPRQRRGGRVGHEVLRAGRDCLRCAAVRDIDPLRGDRDHPDRRRRAGRRDAAKPRPSGSCSASPSSSSASRSSLAPCRSTCGCRTSITARRRR